MHHARIMTALVAVAISFAAPAMGGLTTQHLTSDAQLLGLLGDTLFVGEGRIGNNALNGTHEVDLGGDTGAPAVTANYVWGNGTGVAWSLTYDHVTDQISFTVDTVNLQWVTPLSGYTDVFVRARAVNTGSTVSLSNLVLDGDNVGDIASASGDGLDILWIMGATLADGFTLSGTATLSWTGATPTNSRLAWQIKVGTLQTVPVEETTWGQVKALYR